MPASLKQFLRKIKVLKPCPVKHYRKEDLDFIFNLYNTDHFTRPFEPGDSLTVFSKAIAQLYANLEIHRSATDDDNSSQANTVFYNLKAILKLQLPELYRVHDWQCLAMDILRFHCSEAINDLLAEYQYSDHIHNDKLYTHTALYDESRNGSEAQGDWLTGNIKEVKRFLTHQKLSPAVVNEYMSMVKRYALN